MKMKGLRYIVDESGRKTAAVIELAGIPHATDFLDAVLEDLSDINVIEARRSEKGISLAQLRKELEADGVL